MGLHMHLMPACPPHHAKCAAACDAEKTAGEMIDCEPCRGELTGLCLCAHWTAFAVRRGKALLKRSKAKSRKR